MLSSLRPISFVLFSASTYACSAQPEPRPPAHVPAPVEEEEEEAPKWIPGPSAEEIKQAVDQRNADLRQCYLAGTFKNSQLAGTVNVLFTIDTRGRVSRTSDAGSDIDDPEVVSCVLTVFGNLEFANGGSSDTEVEYPVVFGRHG